ncbi:hypothetical protein KUV26_20590 [Leisingera daeponensis]|uniref:Uncharacterized protein n=1 Tax=Leisingera daeponensis TaxID=405746 RepID=A0ABS7NKW7_9RHOB|nr:hypothetical protein [Leisingera daeponensis]MBY6141841.1 hypothetical protein [Leisingera daeponensis]
MIPPTLDYGHIDINVRADRKDLFRDFKPLMGLSNEVEDILDPYKAASEAAKLARRYKIGRHLAELQADVQERTLKDKRFLGLEQKIAISVEKPAPVDLPCCTPDCHGVAVRNSHALQKNGILATLADENGRILQTKITPFSSSGGMKELGARYASVFPGYCKDCEQSVFHRAELRNAEVNMENVALLLWRALCFIRYRRAQEVKARAMMVSKPEMYNISKENEDPFTAFASAFNLKTSIHSYKMSERWVNSLGNQVWGPKNELAIASIEFKKLPFAGCGVIPIPVDFDRNTHPSVGNFHSILPSLVFTTMHQEGRPHIILACRRADRWSQIFLKRILRMDSHLLAAYIPQILLGGSDTIFLSKHYWDHETTERDRCILLHSQLMKFPQMVFPFWGAPDGVSVLRACRVTA